MLIYADFFDFSGRLFVAYDGSIAQDGRGSNNLSGLVSLWALF
jgi:hypothetical protein